jgi:hypothetical protein
VHNFTIAPATAGLGLLSTLALSPLSAEPNPGYYPGNARNPALVASRLARCGAESEMANASIVIEELPEPKYVHSLSRSEISLLEHESGGDLRDAVGLTLVRAGTVETRMGEAQSQNGASCAVVESVRILPMKEVTVYLAREYAAGSCNFEAIRRHEDEHVAIARRLVTEYRPRLVGAVTGLRLHDVPSAIQGVIDELQRAMRSANRLLDQRDTHRSLKRCASW